MSNRNQDGLRANQSYKGTIHKQYTTPDKPLQTKEDVVVFSQPKLANPGNLIKLTVGGGHLGSKLAHENEAPFPEKLAEFFIKSFCPPQGIVLDPFLGSGTTVCVADDLGRKYLGIDIRQSQIDLTLRRLAE